MPEEPFDEISDKNPPEDASAATINDANDNTIVPPKPGKWKKLSEDRCIHKRILKVGLGNKHPIKSDYVVIRARAGWLTGENQGRLTFCTREDRPLTFRLGEGRN